MRHNSPEPLPQAPSPETVELQNTRLKLRLDTLSGLRKPVAGQCPRNRKRLGSVLSADQMAVLLSEANPYAGTLFGKLPINKQYN